MVRYANEHKQETRQRIIEAACCWLKRDGIDGSGVATLMDDAGLTNGAFYAHFTSKDEPRRHRGRRPTAHTAREHRRAGGARPSRPRTDRALVPVGPPPGQPRRRLPQRRPARRDRALRGRNQAGVHRRRAGCHRRPRRPHGTRRPALGPREGTQPPRPDGRDATTLPRPDGPTTLRRPPGAGPPQLPWPWWALSSTPETPFAYRSRGCSGRTGFLSGRSRESRRTTAGPLGVRGCEPHRSPGDPVTAAFHARVRGANSPSLSCDCLAHRFDHAADGPERVRCYASHIDRPGHGRMTLVARYAQRSARHGR